MNNDLTMRLDNNNPGSAPPYDLFAARPDRKGPKTIAILLIISSIIMVVVAYGDLSLASAEDLTQEELDTLLTNVRTANEENITDEEYQDFHDEARESGAYSMRGWSVMIGGIAIFVGGILLFKLNSAGAKLSIGGAIISGIGGLYANWKIYNISVDMLPDSLILANRISGYLCGICMFICVAVSALPIINASARAALDQKVTLVQEEE